jgi:signal transduction histidine kinase
MQRLINSERLAAAGRMANTLAHEINNPLEALTNIFFLLQDQELTPQAQELLGIGARELERVGHITRSTLSFYRKIPGRTLDLRSMLEEVVQLFDSRASQHNITLHPRYGPGIENAHYDPRSARSSPTSSPTPSKPWTHSGGDIYIRARLVNSATGDMASIVIADNGHGIDASNLACIFEPFFTTKGERGTGLGLWVTRGIVEEQRGHLRLRSSVDPARRGTTIRVTLPVDRQTIDSSEQTVA